MLVGKAMMLLLQIVYRVSNQRIRQLNLIRKATRALIAASCFLPNINKYVNECSKLRRFSNIKGTDHFSIYPNYIFSHVFIRFDKVKTSLQQPYEGPIKVLR